MAKVERRETTTHPISKTDSSYGRRIGISTFDGKGGVKLPFAVMKLDYRGNMIKKITLIRFSDQIAAPRAFKLNILRSFSPFELSTADNGGTQFSMTPLGNV